MGNTLQQDVTTERRIVKTFRRSRDRGGRAGILDFNVVDHVDHGLASRVWCTWGLYHRNVVLGGDDTRQPKKPPPAACSVLQREKESHTM